MTDSFACCAFSLTKPLFYEAFLRMQRENTRAVYRLLAVVCGAMLVFCLWYLLHDGSPAPLLTELVVLPVFLLVITFWIPRRKASKAWQAQLNAGKADAERTVLFYEDRMTVSVSEETTEILYADLTGVSESRNTVTLISRDKRAVILKKDCISPISQDELLKKLKESGGF